MSDDPDTELFSAYLDGELTADEQVRVEQILATSPEARQLLEELRALGSTLQGLPQEKLDEDLSTRVLEVAERRMLMCDDAGDKPSAGRAADILSPAKADSIDGLGVPWREISWRGMMSKRALIWSGVVVATAIIISFTAPPPPKPNQDIAKLSELARLDKERAASPPAAASEGRSKSSTTDGNWEAPAGAARKPPTVDRLAKFESRKAADAEDRVVGTESDRVGHQESDGRTADEIAPSRRRVADNKLDDKAAYKVAIKEGESLARPMSKAGLDELTKDSAPEKARDQKAGGDHLLVSEKPSEAAVLSAQGGQPGPDIAARKPAMRAGSEFGAESTGEKSAGERAAKEVVRGGPVNENSGPVASVRLEEKKVAAPIASIAGSKPAPAAARLPAAPAPATPGQPVAPAADVPRPSAEPPPPVVARNKALGADGPMNAKRGPGDVIPKDAEHAQNRVAKGSDTTQLITGTLAPAAANSSPAEAAAATYGQSRPIPPNRLTGQTAAAATFVRLDVSALAVQQKVFENLLSRHELGNDQDSRNVARNAPADGSNLRSNQLEQGGQGGILGLNRQAKMAANGSLGSQLTASGSASSEGFNQQQVVSKSAPPASLNYEFRAPTIDSNIQAPAAATSPQHGMDVKAPPYQSDTAKDVRQQVPRHVIYYEFDASPEQLAVIIKQIGERSDSFSAPEIESAVSASPGASSLAQNDIYGGNNSAGRFAGRGYGGGGLTDGSVQQQQAMAVGGRANLSLKESAQPQTVQAAASGTAHPATAPAAGTAKQHVVFLLNVVDHLAPIAGRASQLPANAVPAPAKQ